ncbi:hypothetical protein BDW22DRAFT_1304745, partial [Trametopsis cervina]
LVKIVNGLTAKSESPGPMTCAHLLGQPDHYTPETFRVFYWWPFTKYVEDTGFCTDEQRAASAGNERVVLSFQKGKIVGRNQIQDYVHRPLAFENHSLYEFLCTTVVKKLTKKNLNNVRASTKNCDDYSQHYSFQQDHPLHDSHGVFLIKNDRVLLNFVGGTLPRRDRGDHETYCRVMLTMFAPQGWRSGIDLRPDARTWGELFDATTFHASHIQIMDNMNLLYECYDAKHDWAA